MGVANRHNLLRWPLVFVGRANGQLSGGQHIKAPNGTPMANAMLALLQKLDHDLESFGDSTSAMSL